MKKLDFIVVGAQKCGTTSLFNYLSQHPDIFIPPTKEVNFFSDDELYKQGINYYLNYFTDNKDKIRGEVSPRYIFWADKVFKRMHKDLGRDVKIILLLRHPVERAYSQYLHKKRDGQEQRTFPDAVRDEVESYNRKEPRNVRYNYIEKGYYAEQVEAMLQYYDLKNILIIKSEDFNQHTRKTLHKVLEFLDVSTEHISQINLTKSNKASKTKSKKLNHLLKGSFPALREAIRQSSFRKYLVPIKRRLMYMNLKNIGDSNISAYKEQFNSLFHKDIKKLEWLTEMNFSNWLQEAGQKSISTQQFDYENKQKVSTTEVEEIAQELN